MTKKQILNELRHRQKVAFDENSGSAADLIEQQAARIAALEAQISAVRRAALEEAIQIIETHRVPVGNSPAGEMAAEWTMDALHEIRDAIRELSQPPSKD